jgi:hypothetical protein
MNTRWLSTVSLVFGSCLFLTGGAHAFSAAQGPQAFISWESIGVTLVGLVVTIGSAYIKGLKSRVDLNEQKIDTLKETLLGDHYDKEEAAQVIAAAIRPVQVQIEGMNSTLAAIHKELRNAALAEIAKDRRDARGD